ncbi:hypothetical protein HW555_005955 [Spodoptera exigua]|uniref:Anaphase-promoting complex subunit CDC26 n=1 Tax=Spodoptera exigua TaxID=7107 RepID=A0A835GJ73_SPOEX|nr:hypothetical protein HW555_005955 [Spodoptera exigua]
MLMCNVTEQESVAIISNYEHHYCERNAANRKMIRRPLTEITLKLDDLQEYESFRREQGNNSSSTTEMQEDTPKPLDVVKTIEEIHNRIGYAPKKKLSGPSTV